MWQNRAENLLFTVWIGMHWTVGYLVAPVLFKTLDDRQLAGMLAGKMFALAAWVGLVVMVVLLLAQLLRERRDSLRAWRSWVMMVMVALIAGGLFVVQPQMAELKAIGILPGSDTAAMFGRLHGVSSVLHLLTSLMGLALVWAGLQGRGTRPRSALGAL